MLWKGLVIILTTALVSAQESLIDGKSSEEIIEPHKTPINSWHVPIGLKSDLNLSPSDLKIFSGHAIHMFRSKCPGVNGEKLFAFQKYLSKVLADGVEETQGKHSRNERFDGLVDSLTTCAKTVAHPPSSSETPKSDKNQFIAFLDVFKPADLDLASIGKDTRASLPLLDSVGNNVNGDLKESTTAAPEKPTVFGFPKDNLKNNLTKWWASTVQDIRSFFSRTLPRVFSGRKRRSTERLGYLVVKKPLEVSRVSGQGLQTLADEICRVFCLKCNSHHEMRTLQYSLRELLNYLMNDKNAVRALESILDEEFLESLGKCGAPDLSLFEFLGIGKKP